MHRRSFIKAGCTLCLGTSLLSTLLTSCASPLNIYKPELTGKSIEVPLASFGENNYVIVRTNKLSYDIFLSKRPGDQYKAILMKCSHRDAPVNYSTGGLVCNEHGSRFNFDGDVLKAPATTSLQTLPIELNQNNLSIKIQNL